MAYSAFCYAMFLGTFLTVVAFVGDLGAIRTSERSWLELDGTFARIALNTGFLLLFAVQCTACWALISTFLIDHFHLFGLKQAYQALKTGRSGAAKFVTPLFYRWVRHPLVTGMLVVIWSMADISLDRLFLNVAMTGYIAVGVYFEERALTRELGDVYRLYKRHVPSVIPGLRPVWPPKTEQYQGSGAAPEAA